MIRRNDRMAGKVVVVIGGATGIGAASVTRLANAGATVFLADINISGAESLAETLRRQDASIETMFVDQSSEESVRGVIAGAAARFGAIDGLFLNGADTRPETFQKDTDPVTIDLEVWDSILKTNLRGYLLGIRFTVPVMLERGAGAIVCTSSEYGITSEGSMLTYGVAKAGINQLVRHVAARWGRQGIRCNSIAPGLIMTDTARRLMTPELEAHFLRVTPYPRLGLPEDVAGEVLHLLSDDSQYTNGQTISVNGGSLFR